MPGFPLLQPHPLSAKLSADQPTNAAPLGNLTSVMDSLRPAVEDVKGYEGARDSHNAEFMLLVTEANIRRTVAKIRSNSPILHDMEASGQIKIVGALDDISTGKVTFMEQ
jgi:carbonic anhydrase